MRFCTPALILILIIAGTAIQMFDGGVKGAGGGDKAERSVINLTAREEPALRYLDGYSPASVETLRKLRVGQYAFVGLNYLARVTQVKKVEGCLHNGSSVDSQGGSSHKEGDLLIGAAEDHEFLVYHIQLEHVAGCGLTRPTSGNGVGVALAYRNGYDTDPTVVEGKCNVNISEEIMPGWRGEGLCRFHYNKAWEPQYLILTAHKDDMVRPVRRIPIVQ